MTWMICSSGSRWKSACIGFRCVEAWAMTVPWTGFPMKALIDYVQPQVVGKIRADGDVQSSGSGAGYQDAVLVSVALF